MPNVTRASVDTVAHGEQRYDTIGDWLYDEQSGFINVVTSNLGDWRMSMVCAVHELIEAMLCVNDGVDEAAVSAFDIGYESARQAGSAAPCGCVPTDDSEPGEDVHAPYRKQHAFADGVERLLCNQLGVSWNKYSSAVANLDYEKET